MKKALRLAVMAVFFSCVFQSIEAMAYNVYGSSALVYDVANNTVRGYSRTELDYDTAEYYTAYVCGELYKDGVSQVRACQGGFITASRNTQFTGVSSASSLLSDHYVDMRFYDDEYQSYDDYSGYSFLPGYSYPTDWLFYPAYQFTYHYPVSIHLGSTYVQSSPHIVSISPSRALRGTIVDITITGTRLTGASSISAGTGVSVSIDAVTSTEVLATLTMSGDTPAGTHIVTITANGQVSDNSVTFFVQIPTKLRRDSISAITSTTNGTIGGQPNQCGAYRTVSYTLLDQQGQPIITDMPITELISNYSGPAGLQPPTKTVDLNAGAVDDLFAFFTAAPTCPSAFSATFTQNFNVSVGLNVYNLTTTNAITLARNASGTNTIDVVITTP